MGLHGDWKTVTVAINGTTSSATDLGGSYRQVLVLIPALDSATVEVYVSMNNSTFYAVEALSSTATGSYNHATTADTAAKAVIYNIGGAQFIEIVCSASQTTAARTFYVKGIN